MQLFLGYAVNYYKSVVSLISSCHVPKLGTFLLMFKKMKEMNVLSLCLFSFLFCFSFYFAAENGNVLCNRLIAMFYVF